MNKNFQVLVSLLLILSTTALFNKYIIETQDLGDTQIWHWFQLLQLSVIYLSVAYFSKGFLITLGFVFTYPFLFDSFLYYLLGLPIDYGGYEGYGAEYSLNFFTKIILFIIGLIIISWRIKK